MRTTEDPPLFCVELGREQIGDGLGAQPPALAHERLHRVPRTSRTDVAAADVGAEGHELGHALGMTRGVGDGRRAATGDAEKRHLPQAETVHDRLEGRDLALQVDRRALPVAEPRAWPVVSHHRVLLAELRKEPSVAGMLPVGFEVTHPPGHADQGRAFPVHGVRDPFTG